MNENETQRPAEPAELSIRERLQRIELKPLDKPVTADFVRRAAVVMEKALTRTRAEELSYAQIAQELRKEFPKIPLHNMQRRLHDIFPRKKLVNGMRPDRLAKNFLRRNPSLLLPERLKRAEAIIRQNPDMAIYLVAKRVGISGSTLAHYLKMAGIKMTPAEKGRRDRISKGQPLEKTTYTQFFRMDNILIVAQALRRNQDRKKAIAEAAKAIGERKAASIMQHIFTAYLVKEKGINGCIESYNKWVKSGQKRAALVIPGQERAKRYMSGRVQRQRVKLRGNIARDRIQREEAVLRRISRTVNADETVPDKVLFLQIASALLKGKHTEAVALNRKKEDMTGQEIEFAVVGVRRTMLMYISEAIQREGKLLDILKGTRFYDTFKEGMSSPNAWNAARYRTIWETSPQGQKVPRSADSLISNAFSKLMSTPTQLPATQDKTLAIVRRARQKKALPERPRIIRRKAA